MGDSQNPCSLGENGRKLLCHFADITTPLQHLTEQISEFCNQSTLSKGHGVVCNFPPKGRLKMGGVPRLTGPQLPVVQWEQLHYSKGMLVVEANLTNVRICNNSPFGTGPHP